MNRVFVLDKNKQPLSPCSPARARQLLNKGKASVFKRHPFTIILKDREGGNTQPIALGVDPGSKTTGLALLLKGKYSIKVIAAFHITHRAWIITKNLLDRKANRKGRKYRNKRHRKARFLNRTRPKGWLPPSLMSRVYNIETWIKRLLQSAPITHANVELVKFDIQKMENPNIKHKEYQQGTLFGYNTREYLLAKHNYTCAYCNGLTKDKKLYVNHVVPKRLGGTGRVANLVISCKTCSEHKGSLHPNDYIASCMKSKSKLNKVRANNTRKLVKGWRPGLKDAAVMNATKKEVARVVKSLIPKTKFWSGAITQMNRINQGYEKDHWVDAACVGKAGRRVTLETTRPLEIIAMGHGSRQMCRPDKYGFPRTSAKANKVVHGFKTGDIIKAVVAKNGEQEVYEGRVAIRSSGYFDIKTNDGMRGAGYRYCSIVQFCDGYNYIL